MDVRDLSGRIRAAAPAVLLAVALCMILFLGMRSADPSAAASSLEQRTADMLSCIEGVEEVRIVIRTRETVCDEKSSVFAKGTDEVVPCGALVIARGAEDPVLRMRIAQGVCALLGLQASQVDVLSMSEGGK